MPTKDLKQQVRKFWNDRACGEVYAQGETREQQLEAQARARYALEPSLRPFARFADGKGKDVLEIGVGMGADHLEWARSEPTRLVGLDLTDRAVEITRQRLSLYGFPFQLITADAEALPFFDATFDLVFSYGVLHHSPNTREAIRELHRVLKPGGVCRIMIYQKYCIVGFMLWLRYAFFTFRPRRKLEQIYAEYLESPGTKAFTVDEARQMLYNFREVQIKTELSPGDLLEGAVGQRHNSSLLLLAKQMWPRKLIRRVAKNLGMMMLIEAKK
jgi:ubiquinone/menaquinone biosynthesis C-methylase UbiE